MQIQKSLDLNNPPRKGGSNGLMPFGEGAKDLNTSSKPNFTENNISPSPKASPSTLPQGEGDLDRTRCHHSPLAGESQSQLVGDAERGQNILDNQWFQTNGKKFYKNFT